MRWQRSFGSLSGPEWLFLDGKVHANARQLDVQPAETAGLADVPFDRAHGRASAFRDPGLADEAETIAVHVRRNRVQREHQAGVIGAVIAEHASPGPDVNRLTGFRHRAHPILAEPSQRSAVWRAKFRGRCTLR